MFGIDDLVGGILNANAAGDAAEQQANAHRDAMAMQERMYNQQRADHQPWRDAGVNALSGMQNADFQRDFTAKDFQEDPGYAFRMQEGQKALERSNLAKYGGGLSGGQLKALSQYGQDFASNEYGKAYDRFNADRDRRFGRLSAISGQGQNAAGMMSNAAGNYGNQYGANAIGIGDAQAAGTLGKAAGWGQFASGVGKMASDIGSAAMGMPSMSGMGGGGGGSSGPSLGVASSNPYGVGNWMSMNLNSLNRG